MEEEKGELLQSLIELVGEISVISDYKCTVKKQYCNLARRLKLLTPMFEEIRDTKEPLPERTLKALVSFRDALRSAKGLLRFGSEGSKIYQVCFSLLSALRFYYCFFYDEKIDGLRVLQGIVVERFLVILRLRKL